jgi:transcriptional regulator with XRE-family HTH domain
MVQRVVIQRQRIGPAIRKLRRVNDLTLDDLASQAGISASHLSRLERGQTLPSFTVLAQIAHVLGVSVDEFVQLEQDVQALDAELGDAMQWLGFPDDVRRELLSGSIEARRALMETIKTMSAMPTSPRQAQDDAIRAVMEGSIDDASPAINRRVKGAGLNGVGFTRALLWVAGSPGEARVLVAQPGLVGHVGVSAVAAYRALTDDEPLDPQVAAWWRTNRWSSDGDPARVIIARESITRFARNGGWVKGAPNASPAQVGQTLTQLAHDIEERRLMLAITDAQIGDVNMLIKEDGDVLVESVKHRASEDDRARLGLLIRGRQAAGAFAAKFDALWDSLPATDKDADQVLGWLQTQSPGVGAGRAG